MSIAQMNEQEIASLWLAEAARRDQEMDEGRVRGIPGNEVFARIRARFSEVELEAAVEDYESRQVGLGG